MSAKKHLIVVLGSHRCGTSALARSLNVLGVSLGDNLSPPVQGDNDKGYWEDKDVFQLNDRILNSTEQIWHSLVPVLPDDLLHDHQVENTIQEAMTLLESKFSHGNVFGIKDPRLARLLPFWQAVFTRLELKVSYIVACRNPISSALSLAKRDGFPQFKSYWLWYGHQLASLYYTQQHARLIVDYDQLIANPLAQLKRMAQHLDIPLNENSPECQTYIHDFLSESLRHSHFTLQDLITAPDIPEDIKSLYLLLQQMIGNTVDQQAVQNFIHLAWKKHSELRPLVNLMEKEIGKTLRQLGSHESAIKNLLITTKRHHLALLQTQQALLAIQSSTSWKITKPVRALGQVLRKLMKRQTMPCT